MSDIADMSDMLDMSDMSDIPDIDRLPGACITDDRFGARITAYIPDGLFNITVLYGMIAFMFF
jgi:hypothetical protein